MMERQYFVYLQTNRRNGTFYVGVTNDLPRRCMQHRARVGDAFTKRYGIKHLVWFESHSDPREATRREKRIKKWPRAWKLRVIEELNPEWRDLSYALGGRPDLGLSARSGPPHKAGVTTSAGQPRGGKL